MFEKIRWVGAIISVLYFATVGGVSQFPIFVISIFLGATIFHELSHCYIGRIWTSDCTIEWSFSLEPGTAVFHSPHEIPTPYIKLVGAAPVVAGLIGFFLSTVFVFSGLPHTSIPLIVMIGLSGGLFASVSESDTFAVRHPAAFQEYASNHDQWQTDVAQEYI